jgi:hypothetical protein
MYVSLTLYFINNMLLKYNYSHIIVKKLAETFLSPSGSGSAGSLALPVAAEVCFEDIQEEEKRTEFLKCRGRVQNHVACVGFSNECQGNCRLVFFTEDRISNKRKESEVQFPPKLRWF